MVSLRSRGLVTARKCNESEIGVITIFRYGLDDSVVGPDSHLIQVRDVVVLRHTAENRQLHAAQL